MTNTCVAFIWETPQALKVQIIREQKKILHLLMTSFLFIVELPSRNVSFSSDLTTPLFDDSGIHLEFALPFDTDISEEEGDEHGTYADRDQTTEHQLGGTKLSSRPSFVIREEDVESEAGDVLQPDIALEFTGQESASTLTHNHKSKESVVNENLIFSNGPKKSPDLDTPEVLSGLQKSSAGHDHFSATRSPAEAKLTSKNEHGLDYKKKTELAIAEDTLRVQKCEFPDQEIGLNTQSPDKNVLNESKIPGNSREKRAGLAVAENVSGVQLFPGQEIHLAALDPQAESRPYDYEKIADRTVAQDVSRVQMPFHGEELSLASLGPEVDPSIITYDNRLSRYGCEKKEDLASIEGASSKQKLPKGESGQGLELQRASLEGKLESLQEEFAVVLEDRKSLQIRLQAVETRLKEELQKVRETKPTTLSLVNELRQNKTELENQLVNLQSMYEEKRNGLDEALERLKAASVTIQNLKHKLSLVEGEICQREETVCVLQSEMESLRKLLDQAKDQNEQFKKENVALNADIASLVNAKEWLQKQLKVAGEAQMRMQLEASELESALAAKNQLIEQLRCDGARSNQQLTELQQSSLLEKAQILKHIEEVEEGITQQNLAFKELEIDRQTMERTLGAKIESLSSENEKLLKLMSSAVEIEKELDAAKQDVVLKEALLETIVKEKDEIKEQLKLARQSTEEYKRNLDELESKLNETKQVLKIVQDDMGEKECYIEKLQEEKRVLKGNLEVANEERAACDNAIQMLKLDLEKVDRRFKLMKRELAAKKSQLEETTQQKDGFVGELRALREGFENQVSLSCAAREELAQKEKLIEEFQEVKDALEKEIAGLTRQLGYSQDEISRADKERNEIQEKLQCVVR